MDRTLEVARTPKRSLSLSEALILTQIPRHFSLEMRLDTYRNGI